MHRCATVRNHWKCLWNLVDFCTMTKQNKTVQLLNMWGWIWECPASISIRRLMTILYHIEQYTVCLSGCVKFGLLVAVVAECYLMTAIDRFWLDYSLINGCDHLRIFYNCWTVLWIPVTPSTHAKIEMIDVLRWCCWVDTWLRLLLLWTVLSTEHRAIPTVIFNICIYCCSKMPITRSVTAKVDTWSIGGDPLVKQEQLNPLQIEATWILSLFLLPARTLDHAHYLPLLCCMGDETSTWRFVSDEW